MEVIPSFYGVVPVGSQSYFNSEMNNGVLRAGEIIAIIYPEDTGSRSKRFIEYDVLVDQRENGSMASKLYKNCILVNDIAGFADKSFQTLRIDDTQKSKGEDRLIESTYGSKVLLLCVNGDTSSAVILSGARDAKDSDLGKKEMGHHMSYTFNGVTFQINKDGSCYLTCNGATKSDSTLSPQADKDGVGTSVKIEANGNWVVATKDNQQSIKIDHKAGTIQIDSKNELDLVSDKIRLGKDAAEQMVLGNTLVSLMGQILDQIAVITCPSPSGMTGTPVNASAFKSIKRKLNSALSEFIFVKKKAR